MAKPMLKIIQGGAGALHPKEAEISEKPQVLLVRVFLTEKEAQIIDKLRYEQRKAQEQNVFAEFIEKEDCFAKQRSRIYIYSKEKGILVEYLLIEEEFLLLNQRQAMLF